MRIAIVNDSIARGGAERQALNAVQGLVALGHHATLVYYHDSGSDAIREHPALERGLVHYLPRRGAASFVWKLARFLRHGRFDVVHGFKNLPAIYVALAGRLAGIPVVLGGSRAGEYEWSGPRALAQRLSRGLLQGWIVNSEAVSESLVQRVGIARADCHVVPNGILCSEFRSALGAGEARTRLGLAPDAATVTCLAMLRPEKNHSLLIEATHMVLERVPGAWLILAGEGPERQRLERQVASMNMAARVRFLGSRSDVADILAATTVSTLASRYEGLSNTVIESMCAGVPVVITDYPGASDLVRDGENGYVIPRGDARTLADRLTRLLRHPEERDGMGRRGRDLAAGRFGLESMARGLLSVYRSYGATA